jgi:hypothetical protein
MAEGYSRILVESTATMLLIPKSARVLANHSREIIDYTRGAVRILNRKKLEESAYECYHVIQQFNGAMDLK